MPFPKDAALALAEKYRTKNPYELCELLGISIFLSELTENIHGFFLVVKGRIIIYVDSALDEGRRREVVAHELGHILLHPEHNVLFLKSSTHFVASRFEYEADLFSAYLLLDPEQTRARVGDADAMTVEELSCITGLSRDLTTLIATDTDYLF